MQKKILFLLTFLFGHIPHSDINGGIAPNLNTEHNIARTPFNLVGNNNRFKQASFAMTQECNHTINPVDDFYACDLDGNRFEEFNIDLDALETRLIGNQTGLTVTYHDPGGNLIDFSIGNQEVVNQRGILARATDANGCIQETLFNLFALPPPTVPILNDVSECEAYILPILPQGSNYFTRDAGRGTMLSPGETITSSQRIYIFAQVGTCSNQSSFQVNIDPAVCIEEQPETSLVEFPKFFTPNGDGFNDFWQLVPLPESTDINISYIHIFNRYGLLIKQLDPNAQGWDGTFNGRPLPASDYWFRAVDTSNNMFQGHFSLKR